MNAILSEMISILLVQDNRDDVAMIREMLRVIGSERFALDLADTYASGMEAIRTRRHDLILLDVHLSNRPWLEVLEEAQCLTMRAPIILIMDQSDPDIEDQALQAGASDCIAKDELTSGLLKRAIRHAVGRDISKRRQALEDVDRTNREILTAWESMTDAFFIIDTEWRFTYINTHGTLLLQRSREDLIGVGVWDAFPEAVGTTVSYREYHRAFAEQVSVAFEEYYPPLGKWLEVHAYPSTVGLSVYFRDVTDRKQAEAALRKVNDELELRVAERTEQLEASHREMRIAMEEAKWANAAKSDFLSRMSHELRTPMNSILGFAQLMEMDAPNEKQAVRLGHIIKAGQHLLQLINEVLDLSRVESGRLQLSTEPVSLTNCIQCAVDMIRPLCELRRQQILCEYDSSKTLYVHADHQRLSQVLINLLSNATKYNRDGGLIVVHWEQAGEGRQQISVSDSGTGIAPEHMGRLFQPFERLGGDGSSIEGTGLGLALSKRLVELMGGQLTVKSIVGAGSTFIVDLPSANASTHETAILNT